jgi:hypothetical protein
MKKHVTTLPTSHHHHVYTTISPAASPYLCLLGDSVVAPPSLGIHAASTHAVRADSPAGRVERSLLPTVVAPQRVSTASAPPSDAERQGGGPAKAISRKQTPEFEKEKDDAALFSALGVTVRSHVYSGNGDSHEEGDHATAVLADAELDRILRLPAMAVERRRKSFSPKAHPNHRVVDEKNPRKLSEINKTSRKDGDGLPAASTVEAVVRQSLAAAQQSDTRHPEQSGQAAAHITQPSFLKKSRRRGPISVDDNSDERGGPHTVVVPGKQITLSCNVSPFSGAICRSHSDEDELQAKYPSFQSSDSLPSSPPAAEGTEAPSSRKMPPSDPISFRNVVSGVVSRPALSAVAVMNFSSAAVAAAKDNENHRTGEAPVASLRRSVPLFESYMAQRIAARATVLTSERPRTQEVDAGPQLHVPSDGTPVELPRGAAKIANPPTPSDIANVLAAVVVGGKSSDSHSNAFTIPSHPQQQKCDHLLVSPAVFDSTSLAAAGGLGGVACGTLSQQQLLVRERVAKMRGETAKALRHHQHKPLEHIRHLSAGTPSPVPACASHVKVFPQSICGHRAARSCTPDLTHQQTVHVMSHNSAVRLLDSWESGAPYVFQEVMAARLEQRKQRLATAGARGSPKSKQALGCLVIRAPRASSPSDGAAAVEPWVSNTGECPLAQFCVA